MNAKNQDVENGQVNNKIEGGQSGKELSIIEHRKEPSAAQRKALAKLEMSVIALCKEKATVRANGNVASLGTIRTTTNVMLETARRLHRLGYELQDIQNLGERHVLAIVQDWHQSGLSPKTMQNQLSRLRPFRYTQLPAA